MTASNVTQNQNLNNAEAIQIDEAMEIIPAQPINDMNQVNENILELDNVAADQVDEMVDDPIDNFPPIPPQQDEAMEIPLVDLNAQLVGGGNAADAPLVERQPEEEGPEEGPANVNPILRRSTRNLMPKYSKKKKLLLGLPTSDDEEDVMRIDQAMTAMMIDCDPSVPYCPESALSIEPYIPISYKDAMSCPEAILWQAAIQDEYDSLMENGTWKIVSLPANRKAIKSKWVLDFKPGYQGVEPRYKARLVACGYAQLFGVDYLDTYAPVVKHYSIKMVLAIAALKNLEIMQLDIKTAFLYGELQEELYLAQPEGYIIAGKEKSVARLLKPLYGLKQAALCWYRKFNEAILLLGFVRCLHDSCVYHRFTTSGEYTIMVIYVDDGLVCSNTPAVLTEVIDFLKTHFKVRSLPANRFVGIDITRNRQTRTLKISQGHFAISILKRYNMEQCDGTHIPAKPNHRLTMDMCPKTREEQDQMKRIPYRECVGSLMYLMAMTRPDIALAVNQAAAYVSNPGPKHWAFLLDILRYIRGTLHYGIRYGGSTNSTLLGFTDADWGGCNQTSKSTSGILFLFNGGPVAYGSRRQRAIATSTRDAEFYAACQAAKESIWLKSLLLELDIDVGRVSIRCDSKCAIALISGTSIDQSARHIKLSYFYSREQQELGNILVTHISGKEHPADMFTKALPAETFLRYRKQIGLCD